MSDLNDLFDIPDLDEPLPDRPRASLRSLSNPNSWPPQLIFDLALGLDSSPEIMARYELTQGDLDRLFELPKFRQAVAQLTRELRESNTIFRSKAKVQAESYLAHMDALMNDPGTPPATKVNIFQALTKYGDLEPEPKLPASVNALTNGRENQPMRMVIEWAGGQMDHSNIEAQKYIELEN